MGVNILKLGILVYNRKTKGAFKLKACPICLHVVLSIYSECNVNPYDSAMQCIQPGVICDDPCRDLNELWPVLPLRYYGRFSLAPVPTMLSMTKPL